MKNKWLAKNKKRIWTRLMGEASWVDRNGDFRARESYGLISRPNYLYGMLRAADVAKCFGKSRVTVIEFGVASGAGLLNLIRLAPMVEAETGVGIRIVGFDTGRGLPQVQGYKDHPELWRPGDFTIENREELEQKISGQAEIIWGDIADTVGSFTDAVEPSAPIGFISIDVDIYSATRSALRCLTGGNDKYNPAISMYFDDVGSFFSNEWAGELAAIGEFNEEHDMRKIGIDRSLPGRRPVKTQSWYSQMFVCHILDHEARQKPRDREEMSIGAHHEFMASQFLY